jgi:hypothetical protein
METTSIKNVHTDYAGWQSALGFYKDELQVFKHRLTEVASKNTGKEIMPLVEHFQNQFLIQHENIDILHHDINRHLNTMAGEIQAHAGHINSEQLGINRSLQDRFESETKVFNGLKEEFKIFLEKVM